MYYPKSIIGQRACLPKKRISKPKGPPPLLPCEGDRDWPVANGSSAPYAMLPDPIVRRSYQGALCYALRSGHPGLKNEWTMTIEKSKSLQQSRNSSCPSPLDPIMSAAAV